MILELSALSDENFELPSYFHYLGKELFLHSQVINQSKWLVGGLFW